MNDAEARFAERLGADLEQVLGTGILVQDVEIEGDGPVQLRLTCLIDGQAREIHAEGETAIDAAAQVIRLAAETRLTAAFWRIVGPT